MIGCININSVEFQTLKEKSGLSESDLSTFCTGFQARYNRFPNLDEIPSSNSELYLQKNININDGIAPINNIINYTGVSSVQEATQKLNNEHRDLEIRITPIGNNAFVDIEHRPNPYNSEIKEQIQIDDNVLNFSFFNSAISKLQTLYGINHIPITTEEINQQFGTQIPEAYTAKAFVLDGQVYINTDIATVDSPVHENLHILLGGLRYGNPEMYINLVNTVEQLPNYNRLTKEFTNRTRQDVNEELFVRELAKALTGQQSILNSLEPITKYELSYNLSRTLDSILMGDISVRRLGNRTYLDTIKNIAQLVNSSTLNNKATTLLDNSQLHRTIANTKSQLLKEGKLKEFC